MHRFYSPLTLIALAIAMFAFPGSADANHRRHHRSQMTSHCGHAQYGHNMHAQACGGHHHSMHMHHQSPMVYTAPSMPSNCCGGQSTSPMNMPMVMTPSMMSR